GRGDGGGRGEGGEGRIFRGGEAVPGGRGARKKERRPIVISRVQPAVDDGRYPVKREAGDRLTVTADIFKEGHDILAAAILYRSQDAPECQYSPLLHDVHDVRARTSCPEKKPPA